MPGNEASAGQVVDQHFIDRRAFELETVEGLCKRPLGDGELILDRAHMPRKCALVHALTARGVLGHFYVRQGDGERSWLRIDFEAKRIRRPVGIAAPAAHSFPPRDGSLTCRTPRSPSKTSSTPKRDHQLRDRQRDLRSDDHSQHLPRALVSAKSQTRPSPAPSRQSLNRNVSTIKSVPRPAYARP